MQGISRKYYLELKAPTEEDNRSSQRQILDALRERIAGEEVHVSGTVLQKLYPLCEEAEWKLTASLAWDGSRWEIVNLEKGDTCSAHYGIALDLGSTTAVGRLVNCQDGTCVAQASVYNCQIRFGTDILSRIFYCKDQPEHLEEMRMAAVETICLVLKELEQQSGISPEQCIQMTVGGNTTMIHFLLGMDAFCVFSTPYAVRADAPGFLPGKELGIPVLGYVYCFPCKSNYLGGDIISGMIATELYKEEKICAFFDIGTNGELVIGNREFLLCGAGAAGPALEGAVVRTGMRAAEGAVDHVRIENGKFQNHVLGEGQARGICGSGIVDLIAELFLNGWIDLRGKFVPEASPFIREMEAPAVKEAGPEEEESAELLVQYAVEYEPGLYFYQDDIDEFVRTKAAAYTMVEYMLLESGITPEELEKFYVCGAFGRHVSKESAVTIGMYPDMNREQIINAGNTSLEGARKLLIGKEYLKDIDEILERMIYIQYGAVEGFLGMMEAARNLPHIDIGRYPSVNRKLSERGRGWEGGER